MMRRGRVRVQMSFIDALGTTGIQGGYGCTGCTGIQGGTIYREEAGKPIFLPLEMSPQEGYRLMASERASCPHGPGCPACAEEQKKVERVQKYEQAKAKKKADDYKKRCAEYMKRFREVRHGLQK